ncbi:sce7725 family protein [Pedobacter sp. SL55]|uniref:sce7725 family protein n=1 Tax=Pedobacter sp. SL55 TaxID=2995161 RepID=UPI00226FB8B7|nr:sce7725 family protein [Pedobacter sp. SL55]WAC42239.1 sce7725 family protein [Pedobacter sp. SL55]
MYLPYLRGKQFELLALRELSSLPIDPSKISPIIEPLKKELKSVETAIRALHRQQVNVQLIVSPEHGDLKRTFQPVVDLINRLIGVGVDNITPTFLINGERDFQLFNAVANAEDYVTSGYSLVHLNQVHSSTELKQLANSTNLKYNLIHVNHLISMRRGFTNGNLGFIADPFVRQKRNADYEHYDDEFFSNDYFYYTQEGFSAFADYLTIGAEFIEGGMLPYAVVIHLTYKDRGSEDIRIKHFLSDNNLDASDTAGKFGEALEKLIAFVDAEGINTIAVQHFRDYHARGAFPGLGVIKKLSIMHHIELVQSLLP